LYFVENPGMAFGMEFFGDIGKFLLTLFRMVFTGVLIWFTIKLIREKAPKGLIIGIAAMIAGAAGNLIDCLFYGVIFSESTYSSVAQIFPSEGGYAPFMFGNVVDMFYFPIIKGTWPSWVPGWGGSSFVFFRPIFNIADAAITVSVIYLLLFQRKPLLRELSTSSKRKKDEDSSVNNNME
jgi:signal peptidase II